MMKLGEKLRRVGTRFAVDAKTFKEWGNDVDKLQSQNAKLLQAVDDKDQELFESQELVGELLEALDGINTLLKVWLPDSGKAPNTLVASIQAITQPAIRKAKESK